MHYRTIEFVDETGAVAFTRTPGPGSLGWRSADDGPVVHGGRNLGDAPIRVIVVADIGVGRT